MTTEIVKPPYPQFWDRQGNELENGYVYIGTAGADPESSPITVYFDKDLTVPAPQPLRTVNGLIHRGGNPARVFVAGDYSIKTKDRNGVVVRTSLSDNNEFTINDKTVSFATVAALDASTNLSVGDFVTTAGYYASGDGGGNSYEIVAAGTGTPDGGSYIDLTGSGLQAKAIWYNLERNCKQFGAVGDGSDDQPAIQAAIVSAGPGGSVLLPKPSSYYGVGDTLTVSQRKVRIYSNSGSPSDAPGSGVDIQWVGGVDPTKAILDVNADGFLVDNIRLWGDRKCGFGIDVGSGPHMRIKDCDIGGCTDTQLMIGDGSTPNSNGFVATNLNIFIANGAIGIQVNSPATESLLFYGLTMNPANPSVDTVGRFMLLKTGVTIVHGLVMDENNMTDYAIRCEGGSLQVYGGAVEVRQLAEFTANARGWPGIFDGISMRQCSPATGKHYMDLRMSGDDDQSFAIRNCRISTWASATNPPTINVVGSTLISEGLWFLDETSGVVGEGSIIKSSGGRVIDLSGHGNNSNLWGINLNMHDDAKIMGRISAGVYENMISGTGGLLTVGANANWTSSIERALTNLRKFVNGVEVFKLDADATAGNTRMLVYDVDNATLERVSVGAADSGGVGFKVLRIPN